MTLQWRHNDCDGVSNHQHLDWLLNCLTHWGRDEMDAISQTTFSNAFSWMKILKFRIKCHWSLFLRVLLTIFQHRFWYWLGAYQATSHYANQCWLDHWRIYASLGLNELIMRRSKKTSKLRVTGLCAGNSPATGEIPSQMASNAENVSIWWHHHGCYCLRQINGYLAIRRLNKMLLDMKLAYNACSYIIGGTG